MFRHFTLLLEGENGIQASKKVKLNITSSQWRWRRMLGSWSHHLRRWMENLEYPHYGMKIMNSILWLECLRQLLLQACLSFNPFYLYSITCFKFKINQMVKEGKTDVYKRIISCEKNLENFNELNVWKHNFKHSSKW